MVRTGFAALLVAAVLVAGAAEAAAQGDVPTRAEFVAAADEVCEVRYRKAVRLLDTGLAVARAGELRRGGEKIVDAGRQFLRGNRRLAALERPPADANAIGAWLDGSREGFRKVKQGGRAMKARRPERADKLLERANRTVRRAGNKVEYLGLRHCF